jgi:hypothetical protein
MLFPSVAIRPAAWQVGGGKITRILKGLAQGQHAAFTAGIIFWGSIFAAAPRVDQRQREWPRAAPQFPDVDRTAKPAGRARAQGGPTRQGRRIVPAPRGAFLPLRRAHDANQISRESLSLAGPVRRFASCRPFKWSWGRTLSPPPRSAAAFSLPSSWRGLRAPRAGGSIRSPLRKLTGSTRDLSFFICDGSLRSPLPVRPRVSADRPTVRADHTRPE